MTLCRAFDGGERGASDSFDLRAFIQFLLGLSLPLHGQEGINHSQFQRLILICVQYGANQAGADRGIAKDPFTPKPGFRGMWVKNAEGIMGENEQKVQIEGHPHDKNRLAHKTHQSSHFVVVVLIIERKANRLSHHVQGTVDTPLHGPVHKKDVNDGHRHRNPTHQNDWQIPHRVAK